MGIVNQYLGGNTGDTGKKRKERLELTDRPKSHGTIVGCMKWLEGSFG
jgi:hypothetical protein